MINHQLSSGLVHSPTFRRVMYFKFFMVIFIWGLIPLFIPKHFLPFFGLHFSDFQIRLLRVWGVIVLLDFFVYWYIFKNPYTKLSRYLLLFGVLDNAGIGIILLILTPLYALPWGVWANIPFQLFFGYWFWRFYREVS